MSIIEYNWKYPKKLEPVFNYNGRYIVLEGGRSGGKSHFLVRKFLEDRLYKKRDLLCLREYQRTLKQSNYKLFKNVIDKYNLPYKVYSDAFISLLTGSEIVFEGMNNLTADNIKSYEGFADAWVEEGQNFSIPSFELLDPTIRQEDSQIYVSMNRKVLKGDVLQHIRDTFPDDYLAIHIDYLDNPFCPQSIIQAAESYRINKPDKYRIIWRGQPLKDYENLVVQDWSSANIRTIKYSPNYDLHITCDFNYSPNCWILAHTSADKAYYFKEYCMDMRTEDLIKKVLDDYPHDGRIVINGDASGKKNTSNSKYSDYTLIMNELIRRGYKEECNTVRSGKRFTFDVHKSNGSRKARFDAFNAKIKNLNGIPEIFIDTKQCPQLAMNMTELKVIPGTSDFATPTRTELNKEPELRFLGHPFDAASYLVEFYWPIEIEDKD